jgi:hypothetical protein
VLSPTRLTLGVGYELPKTWAAAVDVNYYAPIEYDEYSGIRVINRTTSSTGTSVVRAAEVSPVSGEQVLDVNLGAEIFANEIIALRFGGYTDFSATPEIVPSPGSQRLFDRKIDQFAATLGVGFVFRDVDFTLGMGYVGGSGQIGALRNVLGAPGDPSQLNFQVAEATESRFYGIITGGVSFGQAFAPVDERFRQFEKPEDVVERPQVFQPKLPAPVPQAPPPPPAPPPPAPPPVAPAPAPVAPPAPAPPPPAPPAPPEGVPPPPPPPPEPAPPP